MLVLGLVFTTLLEVSLTRVIGVISPVAFVLLAVVSLGMIFGVNVLKFIPQIKIPRSTNPSLEAWLYGFFFGAIVIPCSPAFVGAFFAKELLVANPINNLLNFFFFGIGLGFPLVVLALMSFNWSNQVIQFLIKYQRIINLFSGLAMLALSMYYLVYVFHVFG
jgi:cytochrome c-type biogenesis protein